MLKKAGIVVATAAAGLLAVSPLAFAGDAGGAKGGGAAGPLNKQVNSIVDSSDNDQTGLVNLVNVNENLNNNNINVCPNVQVDVIEVLSDVALGVLGAADASDTQTATCVGDSGNKQSNKG